MSARVLAWALWALALVLSAGPVLQSWLNYEGPADILVAVAFVAAQGCAATAGLVLVLRMPRHAVGWIFLFVGAGIGLEFSASVYADIGMTTARGPLPGDDLAFWLSGWFFIPIVDGLPLFLLQLFPTGRFVSARWRLVGWVIGVTVVAATVGTAFAPGEYGDDGRVNPLGAPGVWGSVMTSLATVATLLALPAFAAAVASLVVRFRRGTSVERQQLKWFTYAASMLGVGLVGSITVPAGWGSDLLFLLALLALCGLPVAAGVAILRHRLYDIDVVIKRTLVYGPLTATLLGTYLLLVLALQFLLRPVTGESGLAVAGSTLAVAALFRPARAWIQTVVDRRFYRQRYDAERTLQRFASSLRDEIDLDASGGNLRRVVRDTMQPAHVSLWMRQAPR